MIPCVAHELTVPLTKSTMKESWTCLRGNRCSDSILVQVIVNDMDVSMKFTSLVESEMAPVD